MLSGRFNRLILINSAGVRWLGDCVWLLVAVNTATYGWTLKRRLSSAGTASAVMSDEHPFSLSLAVKGSDLIVAGIPAGRARSQLIRLGIMNGETIRCIERLPGGTVVVEKSRQEIAIGAALAQTITVQLVPGVWSNRSRQVHA
jgi:ferrous iron transport protein A